MVDGGRRFLLGLSIAVFGCYSGVGGGADDSVATESGPADSEGPEGSSGDGGEPTCLQEAHSDRVTLRRLTRFEYNNTVRDLLSTQSRPADGFPSEVLANGFGNDASAQSVSSLLAETYNVAAESLADEVTATPGAMATLAPCAADISDSSPSSDVEACTESLVASFVSRAFRRPLQASEIQAWTAFADEVRGDADFATSVAAVVEAVLQSPDFLYRVEVGFVDDAGRRRPTGHEMASRLSYFLWGTMPDRALIEAAEAGELVDRTSVVEHATRMLADDRTHTMVRFFFDNALPISSLAQLERDAERYPSYDAEVGAAMREETQRFLEYEIFEGPGTWDHALTAPYTFMNERLAQFYGVEGVSGDAFVKVDLDPQQRLGVLMHAGVLAGTIHSNETNPVTRGAFITRALMCTEVPLPTGDVADEIKPPDPDSGATARERFSRHSEDPVCSGCHALMDPIGLTFENFDAVGQWRTQENGVEIDASGALPGLGDVSGPVELVQGIADSSLTHGCFVTHWSNFAYGRTAAEADDCTQERLTQQFEDSGHDVQQLLLDLTQSDDFLFLAPEEN